MVECPATNRCYTFGDCYTVELGATVERVGVDNFKPTASFKDYGC